MPIQYPTNSNDAVPCDTKPKAPYQVAAKESTVQSKSNNQNVPMKKQIEDYAQKEEERNNQIAANVKNTHTFARLASQLGEWEENIDGKGE